MAHFSLRITIISSGLGVDRIWVGGQKLSGGADTTWKSSGAAVTLGYYPSWSLSELQVNMAGCLTVRVTGNYLFLFQYKLVMVRLKSVTIKSKQKSDRYQSRKPEM